MQTIHQPFVIVPVVDGIERSVSELAMLIRARLTVKGHTLHSIPLVNVEGIQIPFLPLDEATLVPMVRANKAG